MPFTAVALPVVLVLWLAFAALRVALRLAVGLVVLPFVFLGLVIGAVVAGIGLALAILVPLVPLALVAFFVWTILRLIGRPARTA